MERSGTKLSEEDRVLWTLVARSTRPLKGRTAVDIPEIVLQPAMEPSAPARAASGEKPAQKQMPARPALHPLDEPTRDKLSKGRLPIEGRVDLHGLTQSEAYALLYSFLNRAHAGGVRYVLIITGKGSSSGGDGVLRRSVPAWLSTPAFRMLVSSHDHAARQHGGSGALYVRLRRATRP